MARTPLFSSLRRSLLLAIAAKKNGRPAVEHAEIERARFAASRRSFLERSAMIAGGAVIASTLPWLSGCDSSAAKKADIAIIGAGMAGLLCAYRLEKAKRRVTVFEAQSRVGGRMWTARDAMPGGQLVELGGELIDTDHATMRDLAAGLSIALDDFEVVDSGVTKEVFHFGGRLLTEREVLDAWGPIASIMAADVTDADNNDLAFANFDGKSIADYLDGLSGLDPVLRSLIDVAYTGEYGLEIDQQSAMNLLWLVESDNADAFAIFGTSDERFHARVGSDAFPSGLASRLQGPIEVDHRLTAVTTLSDGRYTLTFAVGGGTVERTFDHVVLTLPWTVLRDVTFSPALPAERAEMISELGYGTNAKLMLGFGSRPWRTVHGASGSGFSDNGLQTLWETSRGQGGAQGIMTLFKGGNGGVAAGVGTPEELAIASLSGLDAIFPGTAAAYTAGSAVRMHWPSFEFSKGSYACFKPGQAGWSELIGARYKNLHFAGEHTSVDFQGYMEGAAESGLRAADEILADLR